MTGRGNDDGHARGNPTRHEVWVVVVMMVVAAVVVVIVSGAMTDGGDVRTRSPKNLRRLLPCLSGFYCFSAACGFSF